MRTKNKRTIAQESKIFRTIVKNAQKKYPGQIKKQSSYVSKMGRKKKLF